MAKSRTVSVLLLSGILTASLSSCGVVSCAFNPITPTISSYSSQEDVGLSLQDAVGYFVKAASKYGSEITSDSIFEQYGSVLSSKDSNATISDLALLSYFCFKDRLPEHIGARKFEAYSISMNARSFYRVSRSSTLYTALKWLTDRGLFAPNPNTVLNFDSAITLSGLNKQLARFYAYIGGNEKDDFFSTVNSDFLYESSDLPDAGPNDSVYKSNLISQIRIREWAKSQFATNLDAGAFYETFVDTTTREDGTIGGLVTDLNTLLSANGISEFISALSQLAKNTGYCPLWSSLTCDSVDVVNAENNKLRKVSASSYDLDPASYTSREIREMAEGRRLYNESVARFTPIFQECLGASSSVAQDYAKAYSKFKYNYILNREDNFMYETQPLTPNKGTIYGDPVNGINLYAFIEELGFANPENFVFANRAAATALLDLFTDSHLSELKGLAIWQMLEHYLAALPNKEATMEWANPSTHYTFDAETLRSDAVFTDFVLPSISGSLAAHYYQTDAFAEDGERVFNLVESIKEKFATRVNNASWPTNDAKGKVKTKLDNLITFVSSGKTLTTQYEWVSPDYLSLEEGGTAYKNLAILEKAKLTSYIQKAGEQWSSSDREEALTEIMLEYDPLFANAFYVPWTNGVVISLGYMVAYPRAASMSDEEFLASYGWVVGHEISHGFDATGIYYDDQGKMSSGGWLSRSDVNNFNTLASNVSALYSQYEVMPGQMTSGPVVLSEAIADITGLSIALDIAKDNKDFDYKAFFRSGATNFGSYASQATYMASLASDEHPFARARVNPAFSVMDEFVTAFDLKEGDGMYLHSEARVKIW